MGDVNEKMKKCRNGHAFRLSVSAPRFVLTATLLFGMIAHSALSHLHFPFLVHHLPFATHAQTQTGKASFYSKKATGSRTASGERLHHDSLTCAHRTYPFGTMLRVTNPANNKSVVVRVTDRGPFRRGRIIDLSWGAAREIGMIAQGVASVIVEHIGSVIIPMKDTTQIKIPELNLAIPAQRMGMQPEWQDSLQVNHHKLNQHIEQTASKTMLRSFLDYLEERLGYQ